MQYSIVKACLLALAATTSVVAQTAGFNVITKPTESEVVAAGATYDIEWIPTLPSQDVSIVVLQGSSNITLQLGDTIASGVKSSAGKFSWAVPADASFAVYGIKIQLDSDPTVFQYSNQFKVAKVAVSSTVSTTAAATITPAPVTDDVSPQETLTEYETRVQTIYSCAPTVKNCPYKVSSTIVPIYKPKPTAAANTTSTGAQVAPSGTAPVVTLPYPTTLVPAPYQNGTLTTQVSPAAPAVTAPVVETPAGTPAGTPAAEVPAGSASASEAPQASTPVFTGAASNVVVSSLTFVGAAALSLMFL